jgi:molecular chaperone DnaJ
MTKSQYRVNIFQNYYQILEVPNFSDSKIIKKSFRKLSKLYHPDRNPNYPLAEEMFKKSNNAYAVLSDVNQKSA